MGSNSNAPPSHRAPERSPPYRYRLSPPATSSRPSPTNPAFPDRYQTPSRRDDYPLPYHSGPPGERGPPGPSTPTWSDRRSMSTAVSGPPYAPHTPQPYSGPPPPPYGGSGVGTPGSRSRDDDYRTGLPPPPPQHYMNDPGRDSAPYPRPRESAYDEGRYDNPHWHDNSRPPYPPYPPSTSRDGGAGPYDPRASSRGAPPNPGYHPGEGYGPQYSHLPPMNFDARDEPPRKRRGNLPRWITDLLKAWFLEHIAHPYPSEQEKNELCLQTGCSMTQVSLLNYGFSGGQNYSLRDFQANAKGRALQISNWFINARRRRTPELTRQAEAERRLRDHVGRSGSNSD